MPVVEIRIMRMTMHKCGMTVRVTMRLADRIARRMLVLMMCIMYMPVFVFHLFVNMHMLVALG